jgi:excisionase family DNA binding protein
MIRLTQAESFFTHPPSFDNSPRPADASAADPVKFYCSLSPQQRAQLFLSTAEVAAKYGIAQRTVQDWINNGLIDAVKVGKKYQVKLQSVEDYLQRCARQREVI